jgi:hypothetical protein
MTGEALGYLKRLEWAMGNGQCPNCFGPAPWLYQNMRPHGHAVGCSLVAALVELGDKPLMANGAPSVSGCPLRAMK